MKSIRALLLVTVALFSVQAAAEKVAVLGVDEAVYKSDAAAAFRDSLKKDLSSDQQQVVDLEKQAKALQEKLQKNQGLMSKDDAKKLNLQFQKAYGEYQKQGQALQQKKAQREHDFLNSMRPKLDKVLRALIKQEGYDIVVAKRATVYAGKTVDITPAVIEQLNKQ